MTLSVFVMARVMCAPLETLKLSGDKEGSEDVFDLFIAGTLLNAPPISMRTRSEKKPVPVLGLL